MSQTAQPTAEQLAEKEVEIVRLTALVDDYKKQLVEKDKTIVETKEQLTAKTAEVTEAEGLISGLQTALTAQATAESGQDTIVTYKGKKFRVVVPAFKLKDQEYKAEDLNENKELLARLVEKKSSILAAL
ncbi:hypothetical protein LZD49_12490 [Dyadobacter sp. CY261]|uniref:hypothetical protein n=1 Tax=Dyadobacter sp. CY261 TaxID=2907203 RepID=UPI001F288868|nr:hypothetical protein [Dyadobacter sp. CY261]MCF0071291.1 hypothetical protein [Dyadobacter sp. CY261]